MWYFLYRYKVIIPILAISILYNLIWFSLFIYLLYQFSDFQVSITLFFLLFYTMIALPIKDWFIHSIFFSLLYPDAEAKTIKDKRIKELSNKAEISHLLRILLREMNLSGLIMVTINTPFKQVNYCRDEDRRIENITAEEFEMMSRYFRQAVRKSLTGDEMKIMAEKYNWGALIPIYYKSKYFGFLAVFSDFDLKKITVLEGLASRIGLILENELLTESAIKNENFKKEFNLARQVEKFLIINDVVDTGTHKIVIEKNLHQEIKFPVLFEKSISKPDMISPYFIFCRISKSNRRTRIMLLFLIAGYFLTHARSAKNLKDLSKSLNDSIFVNGSDFSIDGFLIQNASPLIWRVIYFGKNLQIECDGKDWIDKDLPPLGYMKPGNYKYLDLKNKHEIIFSINQIPCLRIVKDEK